MNSDCSSYSNLEISKLVVKTIKSILYIRGQFPMPFDDMKNLTSSVDFGDVCIYRDLPTQVGRPRNADKARLFTEHLSTLDLCFKDLQEVLTRIEVLEIVLNLGANFLFPHELFHVKLPKTSNIENPCSIDKYQQQLFKNLFKSKLIRDYAPTEAVLPFSIMLLLADSSGLSENMECKRFYSMPNITKQVTIDLNWPVNCTTLENTSAISGHKNPLWVKLNYNLKGLSHSDIIST